MRHTNRLLKASVTRQSEASAVAAHVYTNVLLLRLSKDNQESDSIETQRRFALDFLREKGWASDPTIELVARGESGVESRGVADGALWTYDTKRPIATRGTSYALTALEGVRAEGEWDANSVRRREALRHRALEG